MSKFLLFVLFLLVAGPVWAQSGLKVADPDARLRSLSKPTKRVNDKTTYRSAHHGTGLDMHIHDPHRFKTAKPNRSYTYGKPGKNRVSRAAKKPGIGSGKGGKRRGSRTTGQ